VTDLLRPHLPVVLGLDVGGANLKGATSAGRAAAEAFPLWRDPGGLPDRLARLVARLEPFTALAATMTGELADCFRTKSEGVGAIVSALEQVAAGRPLALWSTAGRFVSVAESRAEPLSLAAANWLALATWVGRLAPRGPALLCDMGSTTSDLIPLRDGRPVAAGRTDLGRLLAGELVYTGVRRTPLCAVAPQVVLRGTAVRPAAELFATQLDPLLLLGLVPEDPTDCDTADGRPATRAAAAERLARTLCCDATELTPQELRDLAQQFLDGQHADLSRALDTVATRAGGRFEQVLVSGSGSAVARQVVARHPATRAARVVELSRHVSPEIAESAPACAVAVLWAEHGLWAEQNAPPG